MRKFSRIMTALKVMLALGILLAALAAAQSFVDYSKPASHFLTGYLIYSYSASGAAASAARRIPSASITLSAVIILLNFLMTLPSLQPLTLISEQ